MTKNALKIVLVNESGDWGGAEKIFYLVSKALHQHHSVLCLLGSDGKLYSELKDANIQTRILKTAPRRLKDNSRVFIGRRLVNPLSIIQNYLGLSTASRELHALVAASNPDIVYLNNLRPLVMYRKLAKAGRYKVVWHEHGYQRSVLRQKILDNYLLKNVDTVIAVSNHVLDIHGKAARAKSVLLNNGIGVPVSEKTQQEDNCTTFIHPAFITRWKGQFTVVKAVNRIVRDGISAQFKVKFVGGPRSRGDEEYLQAVRRFVRNNGLEEYVEFLGYRDDATKLISTADVLISASVEHDPFPTILLEGCALGKPLISSDAGGSPDIVQHGYNGYVFPMGSDYQLAGLMRKMINSRDELTRLAHNASEVYRDKFTLELFEANLLTILGGVVGEKDSPIC